MIQRILNSKNFLAILLAMVTGTFLYLKMPWPMTGLRTAQTWDEYFLRLVALRDPWSYAALKVSYHILLFTTPYIGYSFLLSALYIFTLRSQKTIKPQPLPAYPAIETRDHLYLVVGEIHNQRRPVPAEQPYWLLIPERGLFTGTILIGATGTGKTACSMYPFTEQLLGFQASNPKTKLSAIILEVKGDFCRKVRRTMLPRHSRKPDYIGISLGSEWAYNPLQNEMEGYSLACGIANLMNNLFGRGKDPFWQVAYTNLIKFIIILHKVGFNYVTLFDVYESAIRPDVFERKLAEAEKRFAANCRVTLPRSVFLENVGHLHDFGFEADAESLTYQAAHSPQLQETLAQYKIASQVFEAEEDLDVADDRARIEAVRRWYEYDWKCIKPELRTSVVEGISAFLSLFDDNPRLKRLFCPPKELYELGAESIRGKHALPPLGDLLEQGKVVALDFPVGMDPGLARAVAVMMKLDFERAMLNRIPQMEDGPSNKHWRPVVFVCDEYQLLATVGQNEPAGDEQFFSLSRQAKCIPLVATQSVSSLRSALPGESWRTLLQTFRTKIFFAQTDDFSAKLASELCGQEYVWKVQYNISESGHDSKVSYFTGKPLANKTNITTSKTYSQQKDYRFDSTRFTELRNAESIILAYDGVTPLPPMYCYLKPYQNKINTNWFQQFADGRL